MTNLGNISDTPSTRGIASQNLRGIFNIPPFVQYVGMSPIMKKELREFRNMI